MLQRRLLLCSPVLGPVAIAIGVAVLTIGPSAAQQVSSHSTRAVEAWGPQLPSSDDRHDSTPPSLVGRNGHDLPDAGLRPERTSPRPAASRSIEPAPAASHPGGPPGWPHLATSRVMDRDCPGRAARSPLHVLLCVWLN